MRHADYVFACDYAVAWAKICIAAIVMLFDFMADLAKCLDVCFSHYNRHHAIVGEENG